MLGNKNRLIRLGAIIFALLLGAYFVWSYVTGWAPSRDDYRIQGIAVDESNGAPNWPMLKATGVDFAYLTATNGTKGRDKSFVGNLEGVTAAGIRYGALHHYDICRLANDQASAFITTVPRSKYSLPPAVWLDFSGDCKSRPNRALILSELAAFLSQVEAHTGSPAVLLLDPEFEEQYRISGAIDRTVWLERNYFLPDYSARPWVMWTANGARRIAGVDGRVKWAVVRK